MARFPGAQWRPVPWANAIKRRRGYTKPRIGVFHIAVSQRTTKSLYGFFTGAGKGVVCSHMFVDDYGGAEQYIDSKMRSSADYTGGDYTFSIETAGGRGDDLKEGWSPEALETLAQITAWLHLDEGIPLRLVDTSKPTESGFGWHALGVPATYAQKNRGISQTGGELWSGAVGKVCPGAARIAQIPGIIERAKEIVADGSKPVTGSRPGMSVPTPLPTSKPKPSGGKVWPAVALPVTSKHTAASHAAWVKLLTDVGYKDKSLTTKFQRWLKNLKDKNGRSYYRGIIEADRGQKPVFGPYLIDALQRKLKDDGLYKGQLDAFKRPYAQARGPMLIGSEINYLNRQRKYY